MTRNKKFAIIASAHIGSDRENVGDLLSADALGKLIGKSNYQILFLPRDKGKAKNIEAVYGGGGMIRPNFSRREVYEDYLLRDKNIPYYIYGVGINVDCSSVDFSTEDIEALRDWIFSAQSVAVRDMETKNFIKKYIKINCKVAPCPTYNILRSILIASNKEYKIGIVVSFGHTETYKHYLQKIMDFINDVKSSAGGDNVGLICHDQQDFEWAKKLFPNTNAYYGKSFIDIKNIYSKFNKIISLRGHGIIFAASCGLPCSVVALNNKINSLFYYHYKQKSFGIDFNADRHMEYLKKEILPKVLNCNFKL